MATTSKRLPGDARVADIARAKFQRENKQMSLKNLSPEALQARYRESINAQNPLDNTDRLSLELESQMQLPVSEIDSYDKNPRVGENDRYGEIKESIRVSKVLSPLVVTRRPGSTRFMVGAGGNTRLKATQELFAETGDPKFETLFVTYRPWQSESSVLVAHLVENELRGEMNFWDRANGVWSLKAEIEAESGGKSLSLRQLHGELNKRGLSVGLAMLSYYGFAIEHLGELGVATARISKNSVQEVQPVFNQLASYFLAHGHTEEAWNTLRRDTLKGLAASLEESMFEQASEGNRRTVRPLDPAEIIVAMEAAVGSKLAQSTAQISAMRQLAKAFPNASIDELKLRHRNATETPADPPPDKQVASLGAPASPAQPAPSRHEPKPVTGAVRAAEVPVEADKGAIDRLDVPGSVAQDSSVELDPREAVRTAIINFTRSCGVADLLRLQDDLPMGYFMEIPADEVAIDLDEQQPYRHIGWWIGATHSGQIDGELSALLPSESLWRQAQRMEAGQDETALQWYIENPLGSPPGLIELAQWLMRVPAHVLADYEQLLHALRVLRTHSER